MPAPQGARSAAGAGAGPDASQMETLASHPARVLGYVETDTQGTRTTASERGACTLAPFAGSPPSPCGASGGRRGKPRPQARLVHGRNSAQPSPSIRKTALRRPTDPHFVLTRSHRAEPPAPSPPPPASPRAGSAAAPSTAGAGCSASHSSIRRCAWRTDLSTRRARAPARRAGRSTKRRGAA